MEVVGTSFAQLAVEPDDSEIRGDCNTTICGGDNGVEVVIGFVLFLVDESVLAVLPEIHLENVFAVYRQQQLTTREVLILMGVRNLIDL